MGSSIIVISPFMENYFHASVTLNQLVQDRGYMPLPYADSLTSWETFSTVMLQSLVDTSLERMEALKVMLNTRVKHRTEKKYLYVHWVPGPTLNTNVKDIYLDMMKRKMKRVILIYDVNVTPNANKMIRRIRDVELTLYSRDELQYNVTHHRLQPQFRLCTSSEKETILKEYGATDTQLPWMSYTDPIRKYYGADHGTLIEIRRETPHGTRLSYRIVE